MAKMIRVCPKCITARETTGNTCPICGTDLCTTSYTEIYWNKCPKEKQEELIKSKFPYEQIKEEILLNTAQNEYRVKEIHDVLTAAEKYKSDHPPVFNFNGCRGRSITVYSDRVVMNTSITFGAILTANATDGEKTIFYHDIIGIQYKDPGLTIGYLQLETASGQMNNIASNQFSENTFTFERTTDEILQMKDYITWKVAQFKH